MEIIDIYFKSNGWNPQNKCFLKIGCLEDFKLFLAEKQIVVESEAQRDSNANGCLLVCGPQLPPCQWASIRL